MKQQDPMKTVKALMGDNVLKSERCCGESGTLGVTRPDISTQIRFRKTEEIRKGEAALRDNGQLGAQDNVKILTSCPSCLQGLSRYGNDLNNGLLEADYIVVEMARDILGENWMAEYVNRANQGGIERAGVMPLSRSAPSPRRPGRSCLGVSGLRWGHIEKHCNGDFRCWLKIVLCVQPMAAH
jgi:hypothetical protein